MSLTMRNVLNPLCPNSSWLGVLLLGLAWILGAEGARAQYEVSSWRDHFPYGAAEEVIVANGEVVARTPNALFSVDTATYEVSRFVKGQGLSQSNPTALGYDTHL